MGQAMAITRTDLTALALRAAAGSGEEGAGPPLLNRQVGRGRLQDGFAGPAGIARPDVADDL